MKNTSNTAAIAVQKKKDRLNKKLSPQTAFSRRNWQLGKILSSVNQGNVTNRLQDSYNRELNQEKKWQLTHLCDIHTSSFCSTWCSWGVGEVFEILCSGAAYEKNINNISNIPKSVQHLISKVYISISLTCWLHYSKKKKTRPSNH